MSSWDIEVVVDLLELALSTLEHGRFENIPTPVSPREDELVRAHDIQDLRSPGPFERVRAQHGETSISDDLVEAILIVAKVAPVLLCQPRRVSGYSDAGVTSGRYFSEFVIPSLCQSLAIKSATLQKKVSGWRHLQTRTRKVSIEVRHRAFQGVPRFLDRQGLGYDPEAELLAFQPRLAIGDQRVEEILFRLVEKAKVRTPGRHVTNDINTRLLSLRCHRVLLLFNFALHVSPHGDDA